MADKTLKEILGLNPLSIGSVFPTSKVINKEEVNHVLIPFLSGLFSQRKSAHHIAPKRGLNPLSIGSVFPTYSRQTKEDSGSLNPLSIGSVFPTGRRGKAYFRKGS